MVSPFISLLFLFTCAPLALLAQHCALYDPPVPGLTCFHGDQALSAITDSRNSWMVEFYSSWCGHCQHFAPAMKELGRDVKQWSSVIKVGVFECTESKENQKICSKFNVEAYPTIRFFKPSDANPLKYKNKIVGSRSIETVRKMMIDHVSSLAEIPPHWPDLQPLQGDHILSVSADDWRPTILIFDDEPSYVAKELILDLSSSKDITIHRVSATNVLLARHYSILETPAVVVEWKKDDFHIIDGQSFDNPRKEFHKALISHFKNLHSSRRKQVHHEPPLSVAPLPGQNPLPPQLNIEQNPPPPGQNPPLAKSTSSPLVGEHDKPAKLHGKNEAHSISPSPLRINRVARGDILNAVSYALRREVSIHSIVSGSAFSSLLRFLRLLETAFKGPLAAASEVILQVRTKVESRASSGFIVNRDWQRILETKLDTTLFPEEPTWTNCYGSLPRYRGYPCGLWMLMHTVTILTLPTDSSVNLTFTSKEALSILAAFVKNFFSCEFCRVHFTEMAETMTRGTITYDGDAVLWLWEAHNVVNKRLKDSVSSDPIYPKVMFPSYRVCPFCYQASANQHGDGDALRMDSSSSKLHPMFNDTSFSEGESLVAAFMNKKPAAAAGESAMSAKHVWNRTAVLLYLWNFYHLAGNRSRHASSRGHHVNSQKVLHAAWPKLYKDVDRLHHKYYGMGGGGIHYGDHSGVGFNHIDTGICLVSYVMCVVFLGAIAYMLLRRRRLRKLFVYA